MTKKDCDYFFVLSDNKFDQKKFSILAHPNTTAMSEFIALVTKVQEQVLRTWTIHFTV